VPRVTIGAAYWILALAEYNPVPQSMTQRYTSYLILHIAKSIWHVVGNQPGFSNMPPVEGGVEAAVGLQAVRVFAKVG
jgi:hypothetical protein